MENTSRVYEGRPQVLMFIPALDHRQPHLCFAEQVAIGKECEVTQVTNHSHPHRNERVLECIQAVRLQPVQRGDLPAADSCLGHANNRSCSAPDERLPHTSCKNGLVRHSPLEKAKGCARGVRQPPRCEDDKHMLAKEELVHWFTILDQNEPEAEYEENVVVAHGSRRLTHEKQVRKHCTRVGIAYERQWEAEKPIRIRLVTTFSAQKDIAIAIEAKH